MSGLTGAQQQVKQLQEIAGMRPRAVRWGLALLGAIVLLVASVIGLSMKVNATVAAQVDAQRAAALSAWQRMQLLDESLLPGETSLAPDAGANQASALVPDWFQTPATAWHAQFSAARSQWVSAAISLRDSLKALGTEAFAAAAPVRELEAAQQRLTWAHLVSAQQAIDRWSETWAGGLPAPQNTLALRDAIQKMHASTDQLLALRQQGRTQPASLPPATPEGPWVWNAVKLELLGMSTSVIALMALIGLYIRRWQQWAAQWSAPLDLLRRALGVAKLKQDDFHDLLREMEDEVPRQMDALRRNWSVIPEAVEAIERLPSDRHGSDEGHHPAPARSARSDWHQQHPALDARANALVTALQRVQVKLLSGDRPEWVLSELSVMQQEIKSLAAAFERQWDEMVTQLDAVAETAPQQSTADSSDWRLLAEQVRTYQSTLDASTHALQGVLRQMALHTRSEARG